MATVNIPKRVCRRLKELSFAPGSKIIDRNGSYELTNFEKLNIDIAVPQDVPSPVGTTVISNFDSDLINIAGKEFVDISTLAVSNKEILENGNYTVRENGTVSVNVPLPSGTKSIQNFDSEVINITDKEYVDISSLAISNTTIQHNGTYNVREAGTASVNVPVSDFLVDDSTQITTFGETILQINEDGTINKKVDTTPLIPTKTKNITENGTVDVLDCATASINVKPHISGDKLNVVSNEALPANALVSTTGYGTPLFFNQRTNSSCKLQKMPNGHYFNVCADPDGTSGSGGGTWINFFDENFKFIKRICISYWTCSYYYFYSTDEIFHLGGNLYMTLSYYGNNSCQKYANFLSVTEDSVTVLKNYLVTTTIDSSWTVIKKSETEFDFVHTWWSQSKAYISSAVIDSVSKTVSITKTVTLPSSEYRRAVVKAPNGRILVGFGTNVLYSIDPDELTYIPITSSDSTVMSSRGLWLTDNVLIDVSNSYLCLHTFDFDANTRARTQLEYIESLSNATLDVVDNKLIIIYGSSTTQMRIYTFTSTQTIKSINTLKLPHICQGWSGEPIYEHVFSFRESGNSGWYNHYVISDKLHILKADGSIDLVGITGDACNEGDEIEITVPNKDKF